MGGGRTPLCVGLLEHVTAHEASQASGHDTRAGVGGRVMRRPVDIPADRDRAPVIATIGVYGWTLERFVAALHVAGVGLLVDVRQRRGVRGREYAWANVGRLQAALATAGIAYSHHKELAPTTELRQAQYREDDRRGVGKRSRIELAPEFRDRYLREILDHVDLRGLVDELPPDRGAALFCVEGDPEACHRGLVAERLALEYGFGIVHLLP